MKIEEAKELRNLVDKYEICERNADVFKECRKLKGKSGKIIIRQAKEFDGVCNMGLPDELLERVLELCEEWYKGKACAIKYDIGSMG